MRAQPVATASQTHLIVAGLPFVEALARRMASSMPNSIDIGDLVQDGVLGLIDASLGRKKDALREGRRAVELLPVEKDAINGTAMIKYLAMIAAWIGDNDLACEQLASVVRRPGDLSYGQLKLMPFWDPLRGDPRFEKIVEEVKVRSH